jgi:hypothetical protein
MNKKSKKDAPKASSSKTTAQQSEDPKLKAKKAAKAVDTANMATGFKKI